MSASLVGSEMCIRDRLWPTRPMCKGWPTPLRLTVPGAPSHLPPDRRRTCLLYTSDAADDM
eukprot:14824951-Alexandrium_andersonii.AAC.1